MARFTIIYEATVTIPVVVDIEVDHLGGKHFEEAIRAAAKEEFKKLGTFPPDFTISKFEQSWDDDSIVRHRD